MRLLRKHGFRRRKALKKQACGTYARRNEQFGILFYMMALMNSNAGPILCIDTKKKERLGNLYREGGCYCIEAPVVADYWHKRSDEAIIKELTQIKGVGKWTVEMMLMFTLQRPDVFPVDDLGIQRSMMQLYSVEGKGRALRQKLTELAEPWRPYRTIACRYLWPWKDEGVDAGF